MSHILKLVSLADGSMDLHCGRYVAFYDPAFHHPNGDYDGGRLLTTAVPEEAMSFPTPIEALELWRTVAPCACHNTRADGKPNRPLTAYTAMLGMIR